MSDYCVLRRYCFFWLLVCFPILDLFCQYYLIDLFLFRWTFSIVKSVLDIFITDVTKSVLLVVSALCESFCFTGVVFSSDVPGNRFLSCRSIIGVCITSLFFESWSVDELMILSLFLNCSLRNYIALLDRWFVSLSSVSLEVFAWTCSLGICLTHDCKNSFLKILTSEHRNKITHSYILFLCSDKNKLFIFMSSSIDGSSKICNLRFPTSFINTGFSWFSSFSLNLWFSCGSGKHSRFPVIFSLID